MQTTWVAYEVFKQISERLTAAGQPVTSKAVTTLLDGGEPIDVGLTPPLNWATTNMLPSTESPRLVNTWVTFQVVKGGQMILQRPGFVDVRWVLTGGKPPA